MKKSRFSDSQTMAILKQAEASRSKLERIKRTVRYVWLNNINGRRIDEIAFF